MQLHALSLSLSHTHTHTSNFSISVSLSLSYTYTYTYTYTHADSRNLETLLTTVEEHVWNLEIQKFETNLTHNLPQNSSYIAVARFPCELEKEYVFLYMVYVCVFMRA